MCKKLLPKYYQEKKKNTTKKLVKNQNPTIKN